MTGVLGGVRVDCALSVMVDESAMASRQRRVCDICDLSCATKEARLDPHSTK